MKAGRRALVMGATGFVGSNLARRLVREGWDVHVVLRPASDRTVLHEVIHHMTVHLHDGSTEAMIRIVKDARPDIVFHLASLFLSQHVPLNVEALIRSNILFSTQLVEAMVRNNIHCLVNTGTSWQHYENKDYSPVNLYAATKQAFEAILQYYLETSPLKAITLKLFDTYGPGDRRPKLFNLLRKTAASGEHLAMSPGDQLMDLVYIDDVVEAFLLAAARLGRNEIADREIYAVSSGEPIPLRNLVSLYCRVTGVKISIEWGGKPHRPRETMIPWSHGMRLPGWIPRIGLEDGIRRMESLETESAARSKLDTTTS